MTNEKAGLSIQKISKDICADSTLKRIHFSVLQRLYVIQQSVLLCLQHYEHIEVCCISR